MLQGQGAQLVGSLLGKGSGQCSPSHPGVPTRPGSIPQMCPRSQGNAMTAQAAQGNCSGPAVGESGQSRPPAGPHQLLRMVGLREGLQGRSSSVHLPLPVSCGSCLLISCLLRPPAGIPQPAGIKQVQGAQGAARALRTARDEGTASDLRLEAGPRLSALPLSSQDTQTSAFPCLSFSICSMGIRFIYFLWENGQGHNAFSKVLEARSVSGFRILFFDFMVGRWWIFQAPLSPTAICRVSRNHTQ